MWDHEPRSPTWGVREPDYIDARDGNCRVHGHVWDGKGTILRPAHCFRCDALKCRDCDEAMAAGSEGGFCEVHEGEAENL